jgi:hypothetical protein
MGTLRRRESEVLVQEVEVEVELVMRELSA